MSSIHWRGLIVRALVAAMVVQVTLPLSAASAPASASGAAIYAQNSASEWTEDLSERSANRQVFRKGEETQEILSIAPMNNPETLDEWSPVDTTLVSDGDEFAYRSKNGATTVRFTAKAVANRFRFEHKGRSVTFDLPEAAFGAAALSATAIGNKMRYQAPGAPIRIEYEVGAAALFEDIWLERAGAPRQFHFVFETEGVTPVQQTDGSIWFSYDDSITERALLHSGPVC